MSHSGDCGYDVYCHVRNPFKVFRNIGEQGKAISEKEVIVKLYGNENYAKLFELKESSCGVYFKKYLKQQAKVGPVVLLQI